MKFFVLAGTSDGRYLASSLKEKGHDVLVSALTEYGAQLSSASGLQVRHGALDADGLNHILQQGRFNALIDATHPFAVKVKEVAKEACQTSRTPYIRWERLDTQSSIQAASSALRASFADDIPTAAQMASELGERILLTVGSNTLEEWIKQDSLRTKQIFIRVLPTSKILAKCEALGFKPNQIIAAQGPFSQKSNQALFEELSIDVVITKDSGKEGGTLEKAEACAALGIPLILLKRPEQSLNQIDQAEPKSLNQAEVINRVTPIGEGTLNRDLVESFITRLERVL